MYFGYPTDANPAAFIPSLTSETATTLLAFTNIPRIKWTVKARLDDVSCTYYMSLIASKIRRAITTTTTLHRAEHYQEQAWTILCDLWDNISPVPFE